MSNKNKQVGGNYYAKLAVQPFDVINCWSKEAQIGYYRGNAIKYVMRLGGNDEEVLIFSILAQVEQDVITALDLKDYQTMQQVYQSFLD